MLILCSVLCLGVFAEAGEVSKYRVFHLLSVLGRSNSIELLNLNESPGVKITEMGSESLKKEHYLFADEKYANEFYQQTEFMGDLLYVLPMQNPSFFGCRAALEADRGAGITIDDQKLWEVVLEQGLGSYYQAPDLNSEMIENIQKLNLLKQERAYLKSVLQTQKIQFISAIEVYWRLKLLEDHKDKILDAGRGALNFNQINKVHQNYMSENKKKLARRYPFYQDYLESVYRYRWDNDFSRTDLNNFVQLIARFDDNNELYQTLLDQSKKDLFYAYFNSRFADDGLFGYKTLEQAGMARKMVRVLTGDELRNLSLVAKAKSRPENKQQAEALLKEQIAYFRAILREQLESIESEILLVEEVAGSHLEKIAALYLTGVGEVKDFYQACYTSPLLSTIRRYKNSRFSRKEYDQERTLKRFERLRQNAHRLMKIYF